MALVGLLTPGQATFVQNYSRLVIKEDDSDGLVENYNSR